MADRIRKRRTAPRTDGKKEAEKGAGPFWPCFGVCGFGVWITYFTLYRYVSKYPQDVVCENIYIGTMNASGMTREEVLKGMEAHLKEDQTKTRDSEGG